MKKKRFRPQKNISLPSSQAKESLQVPEKSSETGKHFETVVKNISHTYHKQKKNNAVKNTAFFTLFFFVLLSTAAWALPKVFSFQFDSVGSFFSQMNPSEVLSPENKEMNVLILGVGGSENSAPNLTDSIMYIHYDGKDPASVTTISIPRDLFVQSTTLGKTKINSLYTLNRKSL